MISRKYQVEFDYLSAAKLYGICVYTRATHTESKVVAGESGNLETIFIEPPQPKSPHDEFSYYRISERKEDPRSKKSTYLVEYMIRSPEGADVADVLNAISEVEENLNESISAANGRHVTGLKI